MKKQYLLLFVICSFAFTTQAQYVSIPDYVFRLLLQNKYPSCFDNNVMMDTSCNSIINENSLDFSNFDAITNLEGIQYFKSLQTLNVGNNRIVNIPSLPLSLKTLDCHKNYLTNLPALPPSLTYLDCSNNHLTNLPALGNSLKSLRCYTNNIYCFPVLPKSLFEIYFDHTKIHCIPNVIDCNFFYVDAVSSTNFVQMPVCNVTNNADNCPITPYVISGHAFYDDNSNGIRDYNELYVANLKITLTGSSTLYHDSSNNNGFYLFVPNNPDSYTLTIDSVPEYYRAIPSNSIINFSIDSSPIVQDIALKSTLNNCHNLYINGAGHFTTFTNSTFPGSPVISHCFGALEINYANNGTEDVNALITVKYDSNQIKYSTCSNSSVINTGSSLILTEPSLHAGENKNFTAYFEDSSGVRIMFLYPFTTTASIITNDSCGTIVSFPNSVVGLLAFKLIDFGANFIDNSVQLYWNTEDDKNIKNYLIEESEDGNKFYFVGSVNSKCSESSNSYIYTPPLSDFSFSFFRLKIINNDGRYTYSPIVTVKRQNNSSGIRVSPNPTNEKVTIELNLQKNCKVNAKIFDSYGRLIDNIGTWKFTSGDQQIVYNIKDKKSGIYIIVLTVEDERKVLKLIVE